MMHYWLILSLLIACLMSCTSTQSTEVGSKPETTMNTENTEDNANAQTGYNETLAKELGADEYGMKKYVMAFLKAGPNRDLDSTAAAQLQRQHLDNIAKMAEAGKLVVAGPFLDNGAIRGIYIFNVETIAEAEELTNTDPAIEAGSLIMELHPWYGSAALMQVNELHGKLAKKKV